MRPDDLCSPSDAVLITAGRKLPRALALAAVRGQLTLVRVGGRRFYIREEIERIAAALDRGEDPTFPGQGCALSVRR